MVDMLSDGGIMDGGDIRTPPTGGGKSNCAAFHYQVVVTMSYIQIGMKDGSQWFFRS